MKLRGSKMQERFTANVPSNLRIDQQTIPLADTALGNGHLDSGRHKRRSKAHAAILRALSRYPLLYGWLCELRTCLRRIVSISELEIYRNGLPSGPAFQIDETGNLRLCKQTLACIQDSQQLTQDHQGRLSLLDVRLFVEGWNRGAEWGLSNARSQNSAQQQSQDSAS
jgi:hypothetical protein